MAHPHCAKYTSSDRRHCCWFIAKLPPVVRHDRQREIQFRNGYINGLPTIPGLSGYRFNNGPYEMHEE